MGEWKDGGRREQWHLLIEISVFSLCPLLLPERTSESMGLQRE